MGWTTGFFEGMRGFDPPNGFSIHFYTDLRPTALKAADFSQPEWYEVLLRGVRIDKVIESHWQEMGKFDPKRRTKLVVDEWGVWYKPGEELAPTYILSQPITLRDAVHTGLTFDIFNRHAEKIVMANVAQTVNCIHSLFLAQDAQFVRTPVYHVFEMYRSHMGGRQVPISNPVAELNVPVLAGQARLPGLSASASIRERSLTVTLTNPSTQSPLRTRLRLVGGARTKDARARVIAHEDMRATNTFANPEQVKPVPLAVNVGADALELTLPKQSVALVQCDLS
jgi:alpha-N-arabinofuranosidase